MVLGHTEDKHGREYHQSESAVTENTSHTWQYVIAVPPAERQGHCHPSLDREIAEGLGPFIAWDHELTGDAVSGIHPLASALQLSLNARGTGHKANEGNGSSVIATGWA